MKKLIALSLILVSGLVFAQSSPQTTSRIRDDANPNAIADVSQPNVDNYNPTVFGLFSVAFQYGYDALAGVWERVKTDGSGNQSCRISQDGTNFLGAANPLPVSATMAANAVNNPLWFQISQDGTTAVGAANPIPISDDMAANTLANTIKVELSDGANAFLDTTSYPGYFRTQDGDSTVLQDVVDTTADGQSLALNAEVSLATLMLYNGATLDMGRNSATKAMMTNTENWPACYDEANGWAKTKKEEVATNAPAKETTTGIGASATTVLAARQVLNDPNWCVYLKNVDAASPFTDADIQVSPDNTLWISLTWTACDSLAIGTGCVYCVSGNAYNYMRVRVTGGAGAEVDVDAFYTSNKG